MTTYEHQIKTVYDNYRRVGFICRRSVIFGIVQEIDDGWVASKDLINWSIGYRTRKLAIKALSNG